MAAEFSVHKSQDIIIRLFRCCCLLPFFGIPVLASTGISLALFFPIFINYLQSGLVPRIPTLIVSCFNIAAALISLFCGLILDHMRQKDLKDFEFKL